MGGYLKRLLTAGFAYQAGDILSKGVALFTLPLYTSYVSPAGYGYAETLLTAVILLSIVLRLGVGEAFIRFYYDDDDPSAATASPRARSSSSSPRRPSRRSPASRSRGPLSRALLGAPQRPACSTSRCSGSGRSRTSRSPTRCCARTSARGTYMRASVVNVVVTIGLTAFLVVGRRAGAEGLLGGQLRGVGRRAGGAVVARATAAARRSRRRATSVCGGCSRSACRRCRQTPASTRSRSPTAGTCCAPSRRRPPGSTRSPRSSRPSCSWRCAASSTPGRRSPTRSRTTRRGPAVRGRHDLLRARDRSRRRGRRAARPLGGAAAAPPQLLRRAPRPAVARARLGALRALPDLHRDLGPRPAHAAKPAGRAGRPRRQHRLADRARPGFRHRRRRASRS